jgi:acyl-CoA thioester hydrolase
MSEPSPGWHPEPAEARAVTYRHRVRYLEVDQQGVVFNMWYLGYFDEAMAAFLEDGGLSYRDLLASGFDVQLVHSTIDWSSSLHAGDMAEVEVRLVASGRTSFTLGFEVHGGGVPVAAGQTVYVVVATDGSGKRPIPDRLRAALVSDLGSERTSSERPWE